jgi:hypothetical protein
MKGDNLELTPFLILNDSDNYPSTHTQALEDKYK